MDLAITTTTTTKIIAPVVIHCASGMRGTKAKEILEGQGYTNVVNAGGFKDLEYLQKAASEK